MLDEWVMRVEVYPEYNYIMTVKHTVCINYEFKNQIKFNDFDRQLIVCKIIFIKFKLQNTSKN